MGRELDCGIFVCLHAIDTPHLVVNFRRVLAFFFPVFCGCSISNHDSVRSALITVHSDLIWHFLKLSKYFLLTEPELFSSRLKRYESCLQDSVHSVCAFKAISAGGVVLGREAGRPCWAASCPVGKLAGVGIIQPQGPSALHFLSLLQLRHTLLEKCVTYFQLVKC